MLLGFPKNKSMKRISHYFILLLIVVLVLPGCKTKSGKREALKALLQHNLDSLVAADGIPGSAFCVIFPDNQVISISSGYADKEQGLAMPENPVMFSGSIGKTLVAATALRLVEQGTLDLDEKARAYFQDAAWFDSIPNSADFTLRMLMNHTSGLPDYVYKAEVWQKIHENPDKVWTGKERLMLIAGDTALFEAGKGWSYADANYIVVGMIIENATGQSLYELCDAWFLKPLGLEHTQPAIMRDIPGLVSGYTSFGALMLLPEKPAENGRYAMNPQFEWAGGGFTSNVSELAHWAEALYGGDVLTDAMKKEMLTPAPFQTPLYEGASYGLGSFIGQTSGRIYYGHTGFFPGYTSAMEYLPAEDLALALQSNTDNFPAGRHKLDYLNFLKALVLENL